MRRAAGVLLLGIVTALMCADLLSPYPAHVQFRNSIAAPPSRAHPLGTDAVGRDRCSRMLHGGRLSVLLAPAAALVSVAIALAVAMAGAALSGWWERAATTAIDLVLSLPWLFLLLAVRAMLPLNVSAAVSIGVVFALLGLLGWAGPARVMMAAAKRQFRSDYAIAAKAAGGGGWRLAVVQIAPNLASIALAQFWTTAPAFLLSEANLALLGLGVSEPVPSWGSLLREMSDIAALPRQPWVAAPLVLMVVVLTCCHALRPPREDFS